MVTVYKDPREWMVKLIIPNDECHYLYYPANIHGCRKLEEMEPGDSRECNMDRCPMYLPEDQDI